MAERGIVASTLEFNGLGPSVGKYNCVDPYATQQRCAQPSEEELNRLRAEKEAAQHEYSRKQKALAVVSLAEAIFLKDGDTAKASLELAIGFFDSCSQFIESYGRDEK